MKKLFTYVMTLGLLLTIGSTALSQGIDQNKAKNIRRLLELTKAIELGLQAVSGNLAASRKQMPQIPEKYWQAMESEIKKEFQSESFIDEMVAIYDKNLSGEDVQGLIAFYETPLGQKTIRVLPMIVSEGQKAGERRGIKIGARIVEKMRADGVLNPQAKPDPSKEPPIVPKP
jgi:hypothetical protein